MLVHCNRARAPHASIALLQRQHLARSPRRRVSHALPPLYPQPSTPHPPCPTHPSLSLPPVGLGAPLCLKAAVDALSAGGAATLIPAVRWVLCFGLCGILQHLTKELTYPTFTPVSQVCSLQERHQHERTTSPTSSAPCWWHAACFGWLKAVKHSSSAPCPMAALEAASTRTHSRGWWTSGSPLL